MTAAETLFNQLSDILDIDGSRAAFEKALTLIDAALRAEQDAMKERCAQVAEVQAGGHYMARICAVAIRALE